MSAKRTDHDASATRYRLRGAERRCWPTETGSADHDFTIDGETYVAVSGDWESRGDAVFPLIRRLSSTHPSVRTVLHLGDLRWAPPRPVGKQRLHLHEGFLPKLNAELATAGLRLLLTPGNHDDWSSLLPAFRAHPERPRRLAPCIWAMPRGFRFDIRGRTFLSFGGAASLDADRGPEEIPTDDDVRRAACGGRVDVLLTHEPTSAGIAAIGSAQRSDPRWTAARLELSASSRSRIDRLADEVQPKVAFHAHTHVGGRAVAGHRTTVGLPVIGEPGNTVLLRLETLDVDALETAAGEANP